MEKGEYIKQKKDADNVTTWKVTRRVDTLNTQNMGKPKGYYIIINNEKNKQRGPQ